MIKITGNARTAQGMADNIDVDVSGVMSEEETFDAAAERLFDEVLEVASGGRPRRSGSAIASSRFIGGIRRSRGSGMAS